jgi:hypothetical protein
MNYPISQEWQEIGLRNFVHMLFDSGPFECERPYFKKKGPISKRKIFPDSGD